MKTTKSKTKVSRMTKCGSPVVMITVVLAIFAIVFLSFVSYKIFKSKRVVIDMGQYVLINEDNINTINPGKMAFPTTAPNVKPPTTLPQIK